jgi:DNA polymerase
MIAAGAICRALLSSIAMGLEREEVYIANVMKCKPPANRVPERSLG